MPGDRIAVIGTGISGLVAAHELQHDNEITVFEANDYLGGHTHTVDVEVQGRPWAIDTGFIVYNEPAYPNFVRLLDELGVETQTSSMSFAVRCDRRGIEWGGTGLRGVFAQPSNALRPGFWRMLRDIRRFGVDARGLLDSASPLPLAQYLDERGYSQEFADLYLIPMSAAIWSATPDQILCSPAAFFVRFFDHHGVLDVLNAPQWRVVRGGSRQYVEKLTQRFRGRIHSSTPVESICRRGTSVEIRTAAGDQAEFDRVVIATHSDQALRLIEHPTPAEREILGAIPYQDNDVVLHTDTSLMPRRRAAWASWNYHVPREESGRVTVTYHMNRLQVLRDAPVEFLVSLNRTAEIAPERVLARFRYDHPLLTTEALEAQKRHGEIDGADRIHFCGAYWGNGFHEDGVDSALASCRRLRESVPA